MVSDKSHPQIKEQKKYSWFTQTAILNYSECWPTLVGESIKIFVGALQSELWIEACKEKIGLAGDLIWSGWSSF